GGGGGYCSC
ncbi:polymorphic outer membrane protein, partial [Chlamydia psittaci C1/97]